MNPVGDGAKRVRVVIGGYFASGGSRANGSVDARWRFRYIIRNSTNNVMTASTTSRNCAAPDCAPGMEVADSLDAAELATLMKALAHPARIELLRHLASVGECFFGDLSELTGLAPSTT